MGEMLIPEFVCIDEMLRVKEHEKDRIVDLTGVVLTKDIIEDNMIITVADGSLPGGAKINVRFPLVCKQLDIQTFDFIKFDNGLPVAVEKNHTL